MLQGGRRQRCWCNESVGNVRGRVDHDAQRLRHVDGVARRPAAVGIRADCERRQHVCTRLKGNEAQTPMQRRVRLHTAVAAKNNDAEKRASAGSSPGYALHAHAAPYPRWMLLSRLRAMGSCVDPVRSKLDRVWTEALSSSVVDAADDDRRRPSPASGGTFGNAFISRGKLVDRLRGKRAGCVRQGAPNPWALLYRSRTVRSPLTEARGRGLSPNRW